MAKPFKRGKEWYVVVALPRDASGKRKQAWLHAPTLKGVLAKETALRHDLLSGTYAEPSRQTVAAYIAEWFDAERHRLAETTADNYAIIIRLHIAPAFGVLRLDQLTPTHIQRWLAGVRAKGLSSSRVMAIWSVLTAALSGAVKLKVLSSNPCEGVTPPTYKPEERAIWDEATARAFVARVAGVKHEALYLLIVGTGLRRGELLGLRWQDIDLRKGILIVRKAQAKVQGKGIILKGPKTPKSRRQITIPAFALAALRAHRAVQDAERAALGALWEATDLVFCKAGGATLPPATLEYEWFKLRKELIAEGYAHCTLHDLRHLHATLGLASGIHPKVMSERLGHSNVGITLDLYSHVTASMQEQAAIAIEGIIAGNGTDNATMASAESAG